MAIGFPSKNQHTLPPGHKPYGGGANESSGSTGPTVGSGDRPGYASRAAQDYRAAHRETPMSEIGNNPAVHSKNTRRYGEQGSGGDFPHSSTGRQPTDVRELHAGDPPPSILPARHHGVAPVHSEKVGYPGNGAPLKQATHPLASKKLSGSTYTGPMHKGVGMGHTIDPAMPKSKLPGKKR